MFKLQPKPTFWAKVPIPIAGNPRPAQLDIEFKHLETEDLKEYLTGLSGREDADAMGDIVCGWKGVDESFSPDALAKLLSNYTGAASSLMNVYIEESTGAKDGRPPKTKN